MRKQIEDLRKAMRDAGMDVFYCPAGDPHGSEYVNDHYKNSEILSGLHAENETLVVTQDAAHIWTDGRFFLQAETELAGSGIELMKMGEEGVPTALEFMASLAKKYFETHTDGYERFVIGFNGDCVPATLDAELKKAFEDHTHGGGETTEGGETTCGGEAKCRIDVMWDRDLAESYWENRPEVEPSKIWELPLSSAGRIHEEKLAMVRAEMKAKGADYLILTDLMDTAWLTNLRGSDIACTPVFFAYTMISQDKAALYVMDGALDETIAAKFEDIEIKNYDEIAEDVSKLPGDAKVWMDLSSASYALYKRLPAQENVINEATPVSLDKAVKNETEIKSTINAHIKDGVAVTRFIRWIKDAAADGKQTEISAADYLEARRREQEGCFDLSFPTISGYGPNGAIIHYAPSEETNLSIKPDGFLLVDSGGQYIDGTTDITRTIAVGPLTREMIEGYTRVLKCHIALSTYVITPETSNKDLDSASRAALREVGLDYKHGVSHGVGHVLAVHEPHAGVKRTDTPANLRAGMIMSNEPGLYIAGEYGIRIENEILLKDNGDGALVSEPITYVPYERKAIDASMLTDEELKWVNDYHAMVREKILPHLDGEDAEFLLEETAPLEK